MTGPSRLIGVDVGGTFTDVMAIEGDMIIAAKVPTDPFASETSVLAGAAEVEASRAKIFNLASTAGLNAIITRQIPKIGFLTTLGHRDVLDRGRLWRPFEALTDPSWRREFSDSRRPLVPRYLRRGIVERIRSDGTVLVPLDEIQTRTELELLGECGVKGIAICLLNSYVNPAHEIRLRELIRLTLGDIPCSISSEVSPLAKEYPRASTTAVDIIMKLAYSEYTDRLRAGLGSMGFQGELNYADCAAMLMPWGYAMERPYRLVVGGPASGTAAAAHFGTFTGEANLLCADVGGTSTDISIVLDGQPWVNSTFELEWDLVVSALATEIVTLGAGGGSIVSIGESGELLVGPDSAGVSPGPACYGRGGQAPTVTDAALAIGILAPDRFLGGKVDLYRDQAIQSFERLDTSMSLSERVRQAWLIALHNIGEGLLDLTIRRGIDVRDFSLLAFGAAGPMILPSLLDVLPVKRVTIPPNPGGFSALGLLSSDRVYSDNRTLYGVLDDQLAPQLSSLFKRMEIGLLDRAGATVEGTTVVRTFDGRLLGQGSEMPFVAVPEGDLDSVAISEMVNAFHAAYERRTGNRFEQFPVEGVTYRVQVIVPSEKAQFPVLKARAAGGPRVTSNDSVILSHLYGSDVDALCFERADLAAGDVIEGAAIIREAMSTTFVPLGRTAVIGTHGEVVVE